MKHDIKKYFDEFQKYLQSFDKEKALEFSHMLLSEGKVTVSELYEEIIAPTLNSIVISRDEEDSLIWKEHAMTGIARSVIECAYPFVLKERAKNQTEGKQQRVMMLCPLEEYHEIGARMGADFFTIANYEVLYIGANTPKENFFSAYNSLKPDIISITITNYLNLVSLKSIIAEMKKNTAQNVKIVLSGLAFKTTQKTAADFGADALVTSMKDVFKLRGDNHCHIHIRKYQ